MGFKRMEFIGQGFISEIVEKDTSYSC